ncbi:NADH:ubiquinone reductase (Na(+)-transporting) subunit B [Ornithobacterium rhinotracheale]|uniref:NADH:ubiquinone reductase (Na(+)-transporting) subunit B n=1 Tax=Ornithobacterium rhinotracheale TaxID=28251 RepID=UPI001FF65663|nr:NADH:ubiquinone reductase (Na(+)-transporting) subunit B [Ornithobacterium rhinotracheale]MCK0201906.1 NADH:ubiquinone reductase (Na(+)-transporting) subunit B [Ornithobacterium rhinotracheale]
MALKQNLHKLKQKYAGTSMGTVFGAFHTFLYTPDEVSASKGSQIHDAADLKRVMNTVIIALIPCLLFAIWNAGYQHFLHDADWTKTNGVAPSFLQSFSDGLAWDYIWIGIKKIIPLLIVSYVVGLGIEFLFAAIKKHEVEEGYLVTGILVPLIVPIDIPLWMLAVAVAFGVVIGKEVFGGTGMNILNPALTIRAFLFFAYPTWMSGDKVWVAGAVDRMKEIAGGAQVDAISGETILGHLAQNTPAGYSVSDMFFGFIPGSVGETSTFLILLGALYLIYSGIGSWKIILSTFVGGAVMGLIFNGVVDAGWISEYSQFYGLMSFPWWQQLIIGGFAFGAVFMATDPVTAAQTEKGKYIYGFLVGFLAIMIRCFNPAYPEGVMLAILLMNVFAPTIDYYVIQGNISKRKKRLKLKTA